jgi:hypothetical protein
MKLQETAARINVHLKRLEADGRWNRHTWTDRHGTQRTQHRLYNASAGYHGGSRITLIYVSYQGQIHISKAEALAYLAWLDAGGRGSHFEQQSEQQEEER